MDKRKKFLIIGVIAFVVILIAAIGTYLFISSKNKEEKAACTYNGVDFKVGQKFRDKKLGQDCECKESGLECSKTETADKPKEEIEEPETQPEVEEADPIVYEVYTNPDYTNLRLKYPNSWTITVEEYDVDNFELGEMPGRRIILAKDSSTLTLDIVNITTFGFSGASCALKSESEYKYLGNEFTRAITSEVTDYNYGYSNFLYHREYRSDDFISTLTEPSEVNPPFPGSPDDYAFCSNGSVSLVIIETKYKRDDGRNLVSLANATVNLSPFAPSTTIEEIDQIIIDSLLK